MCLNGGNTSYLFHNTQFEANGLLSSGILLLLTNESLTKFAKVFHNHSKAASN